LNDTKLMYCRNRYLLPDILAKARIEQTPAYIFNAKNSFSQTRSARNMSIEHGCRDEGCVACKKLQDSMKTQTEKLKNSYRDVKAGVSHVGNGDGAASTTRRCLKDNYRRVNGELIYQPTPVSYETNLLFDVNAEDVEDKSSKPSETEEDKRWISEDNLLDQLDLIFKNE